MCGVGINCSLSSFPTHQHRHASMEQTRQVRESDGESTDSPCLRGYCLLLLVVGEVDDNARIGSNYPRVGFCVSEFNVTNLLFEALELLKERLTTPGVVCDC